MNEDTFTPETVEKIKALLEESITRKISLEEIARRVCVSRYYMTHMFKKYEGITPLEYRNRIQLQKAKKLLCEMDIKVTSIAVMCGYKHAAYFSARFKEAEGITPQEYRDTHTKED